MTDARARRGGQPRGHPNVQAPSRGRDRTILDATSTHAPAAERRPGCSIAALVAALAAGLLAVSLGSGLQPPRGPGDLADPTGDNTDVYAFTAKDAPGSITVVANWIPLEDPAGGPNFFRFDDNADYYVNVDNTGEGKPDVRYLFKFKTKVRNPNSFLYALPGVTGFNDPKLNIVQTYDVFKEDYEGGRLVHVEPHRPRPARSRRTTSARRRSPRRSTTRSSAGSVKSLERGGKVFAGQRDDPFFVDLGAAFDAINLRVGTGNAGRRQGRPRGPQHARDRAAGAREGGHPRRQGGERAGGRERGRGRLVVDGPQHGVGRRAAARRRRRMVQVSRLGNPLVNEVVIPLGKKDQFNRTTPDKDAAVRRLRRRAGAGEDPQRALSTSTSRRRAARTSSRRCSRACRARRRSPRARRRPTR